MNASAEVVRPLPIHDWRGLPVEHGLPFGDDARIWIDYCHCFESLAQKAGKQRTSELVKVGERIAADSDLFGWAKIFESLCPEPSWDAVLSFPE